MHHDYHKSRRGGEDVDAGERVLFCPIPRVVLSFHQQRTPAHPAACLLCHVSQSQVVWSPLPAEQAGKGSTWQGDGLGVTVPPCTELGFCWQTRQ